MTALVDTASCAVLDVHCSAHWPNDTHAGCRVALRNTAEIEVLAGAKGYDDQSNSDCYAVTGFNKADLLSEGILNGLKEKRRSLRHIFDATVSESPLQSLPGSSDYCRRLGLAYRSGEAVLDYSNFMADPTR